MPKTISALAAICVIAVAAPAFAQQGKKDTSSGGLMVFVGYSTEEVLGDAGVTGLTRACGSDFGEQARVCTTEEFMLSTDTDEPGVNHAWILPVFFGSEGANIVDYSGAAAGHKQMSCEGWTSDATTGIVVTTGGGIIAQGGITECNVLRQVTCCAPAQ